MPLASSGAGAGAADQEGWGKGHQKGVLSSEAKRKDPAWNLGKVEKPGWPPGVGITLVAGLGSQIC